MGAFLSDANELRHAINADERDRIAAKRLIAVDDREITGKDTDSREALISHAIERGGVRPRDDEFRDAQLVAVEMIGGSCERHRERDYIGR